MKQYKELLQEVFECGHNKSDRTGTGTVSSFGHLMRFDLNNNSLPIITGKKIHLKSIIHELIWMISGDTNIRYLKANGVRIWDEWVKPGTEVHDEAGNLVAGELGPIYGAMWRRLEDVRTIPRDGADLVNLDKRGFEFQGEYFKHSEGETYSVFKRTIDQFSNMIELLKKDPDSRRIVVNGWQVAHLDEMALTPCHHMFQMWTRELTVAERLIKVPFEHKDRAIKVGDIEQANELLDELDIPKRALSCKFDMRSNDMFLGNPFNVTFYALLTHALANMLNMEAEQLVYSGGDCHIYDNHVEQVEEQLSRDVLENTTTVTFPEKGLDVRQLKFDDFIIRGYESHPAIKAPVAI